MTDTITITNPIIVRAIKADKDEITRLKADYRKLQAEYDRLAEALEEEKRWSARYKSQQDELATTLRTILSISLMDKGHWAKTIELEVVAALAKVGEQP